MKKLLIILLLCSSAFAQSTAFKKQTSFKKQTWFGAAASGNNLAFVQACEQNQTSSTTSLAINIGATGNCSAAANPVGGHLVVVYLPAIGTGITGQTDTLGNSWTCLRDSGGTTSGYCYSKLTTGGSADTLTVTTTANSVGAIISFEFSGENATPLDGAATFSTVTASTSWTMVSLTTSNANDVIISCGNNISVNNTFTQGSGYTIPTDGQVSGGGQSGFCQYQKVTVATTYTPTVGLASSMTGLTMTIAFKSS